MNRKSKLIVALMISTFVVLSSMLYASFAPRTLNVIQETSEIKAGVPLFMNYSGPIISEKFQIDNISAGVLSSAIVVYIYPVWTFSGYSVIPPPSAHITDNRTLLNSYGPTFTLEATLYHLQTGILKNTNGTEYGGISLTNNTVSTSILGVMEDALRFPLQAPSINIGSGSYDLKFSLFMNTSFPIQNSNYSAVVWQIGITNLNINENLNGYLFKQIPSVTLLNVTRI